MTTLYSLAERLRVGDSLQLKSRKADVEKQQPKTVTRIEADNDRIRVYVEGPESGQYAFWVDSDGSSQTIFHDPEEGEQKLGPVELARLVYPGNGYIST